MRMVSALSAVEEDLLSELKIQINLNKVVHRYIFLNVKRGLGLLFLSELKKG